jgi:hypothetical protein
MNLKEKKEKFLFNVFFSNSVSAAFQRNRYVYSKDISDEQRKVMKGYLFNRLQDSISEYAKPETVVDRIENLQQQVNQKYQGIFKSGLPFGTVQKLVNLYLKYLWCADLIEFTPPHCPVDGQVLKDIGLDGKSFTKMDKEEYRQVIEKITEKHGKDIAKWELENWPFRKEK